MSSIIQQYRAIKAKYPDAILLFRIGDTYQSYEGDAVCIAPILGLTLHQNGEADNIKQWVSFPHFSLDYHLNKLVKKG